MRSRPERALISVLIAFAFLWVFRRGGLPLLPPASAFANQTWWAVPGYVGLTFVGSFLRTYRWVYLLRPLAPNISRWRVLGIGYVGFTAIFLAPLRTGEVVRPYLIAQDGEVSFLQGMGTVAAERVVDGLVLTLLSFLTLSLSTPISPLPDRLGDLPLPVKAVPGAMYTALLIFAGAFAVMALFYWARVTARALTRRVLGVVSTRLADAVTSWLERLADGLQFLPSRTHFLPFLRDTLVYWAVGATSQWVLLRGLGIEATVVEACVTLGVMGIGSLIPAGPGFFGAFQISAYSALALFYDRSTLLGAGSAFVFLSYTGQLVVNVLCCVLGFLLLKRFPSPRTGEVTV